MEFEIIKKRVLERIDAEIMLSDEELSEIISEEVSLYYRNKKQPVGKMLDLTKRLFDGIRGLDVLQSLLEDDEITEIMINGPNNIFIEKSGKLIRYDAHFQSKEKLLDIIQTIVGKANKRVNEVTPIVDTRLDNGSRVNVVLDPIAVNGPVITIRKFSSEIMDMERLIELGSISLEAAKFMEKLVLAGYNIFISGGTSSGKTTFLNILSNFIPKNERIITIEDSAELQISKTENLVSLEVRQANTEGKNEISIRELIKASLRMRPDRVIVGEIRGAEALDMLQAMNTGHDGSLSTGHANSAKDMISRIETMVLMGANLPLSAIKAQIGSALDIIVHLGRMRDRTRKVLEITEIVEYKEGEIITNKLFEYKNGLVRTDNPLINKYKLELLEG